MEGLKCQTNSSGESKMKQRGDGDGYGDGVMKLFSKTLAKPLASLYLAALRSNTSFQVFKCPRKMKHELHNSESEMFSVSYLIWFDVGA